MNWVHGIWCHAKSATLSSAIAGLAFSLEKGCLQGLFRGWERTKKPFFLAGISYSIEPKTKYFEYAIKIGPKYFLWCSLKRRASGCFWNNFKWKKRDYVRGVKLITDCCSRFNIFALQL